MIPDFLCHFETEQTGKKFDVFEEWPESHKRKTDRASYGSETLVQALEMIRKDDMRFKYIMQLESPKSQESHSSGISAPMYRQS